MRLPQSTRLGAPHRRCKSLILRQGPLPRRQEARCRLHKVPVKTLHIDTAYTVRQRYGNHIATMRNAYVQIGIRNKTGRSRGVILHAYISSQISVQQGPPRQILASAVLRNKGGDRMQIILARRRRQLRLRGYRPRKQYPEGLILHFRHRSQQPLPCRRGGPPSSPPSAARRASRPCLPCTEGRA